MPDSVMENATLAIAALIGPQTIRFSALKSTGDHSMLSRLNKIARASDQNPFDLRL